MNIFILKNTKTGRIIATAHTIKVLLELWQMDYMTGKCTIEFNKS